MAWQRVGQPAGSAAAWAERLLDDLLAIAVLLQREGRVHSA